MELTIETDTDQLERERVAAVLNIYAGGLVGSYHPQDRLTQPQYRRRRAPTSLERVALERKRQASKKKKRTRKGAKKSRRRNR